MGVLGPKWATEDVDEESLTVINLRLGHKLGLERIQLFNRYNSQCCDAQEIIRDARTLMGGKPFCKPLMFYCTCQIGVCESASIQINHPTHRHTMFSVNT